MMWWLVSKTLQLQENVLCPVSIMTGSLMQRTVGMLENKTCEISDTGNCCSVLLLEIRRKSQLSDSLTQSDTSPFRHSTYEVLVLEIVPCPLPPCIRIHTRNVNISVTPTQTDTSPFRHSTYEVSGTGNCALSYTTLYQDSYTKCEHFSYTDTSV